MKIDNNKELEKPSDRSGFVLVKPELTEKKPEESHADVHKTEITLVPATLNAGKESVRVPDGKTGRVITAEETAEEVSKTDTEQGKNLSREETPDTEKLDPEENDLDEKTQASMLRRQKRKEAVLSFLKKHYKGTAAFLVLAGIILGLLIYDKVVVFNSYTIAASYDNEISSNTGYLAYGKNIIRYNSDGLACVTRNNDMLWSVTYSMQAPLADMCGDMVVIAEQHGTQVYLANNDGAAGSFETDLPILKIRVSENGLVAAMLQDDNITWINLYDDSGDLIVSARTTLEESGYPLDFDLSQDGKLLAVSYLKVTGGILSDDIVFYQFGQTGDTQDDHKVKSINYSGEVIPELYFTENSELVAISDCGYYVYEGTETPDLKYQVHFDSEILSAFHDGNILGFVLDGEEDRSRYQIELYTLDGRKKKTIRTDYSYDSIKLQNGEIILNTDRECTVYKTSGHLRFHCSYEKEIEDIFYFSEFRKYLFITESSFDRIRIRTGGDEEE